MRILLFHPTLLPPRDYGGVERVLLWLARGLVERGHRVYVAARRGSRLPPGCELVEAEPRSYCAQDFSAQSLHPRPNQAGHARPNSQLNSRLKLKIPEGLDILHFMAPLAPEIWSQLPCPALLTVHGNAKPGERYPKNSVFLSQNHATRHGAQKFIYNGIDPSEYQFTPHLKSTLEQRAYLFLSKTNWRVKNLAGALRVCNAAGVPLKIAGGNRPLLKRLSCSFRSNLQWVGPVNGEIKAKLLAEAKALIFPVAWPEPFGLVVAEALISGTPVLASRRGSLPELVPSDVGALFGSEHGPDQAWDQEWDQAWDQEWIEFLRQGVLSWEPERCREWAMSQFHYAKMAESYELAYQQVIAGELLNREVPQGGNWKEQQ